jgi:hypothetical protein
MTSTAPIHRLGRRDGPISGVFILLCDPLQLVFCQRYRRLGYCRVVRASMMVWKVGHLSTEYRRGRQQLDKIGLM